MKFDWFCWDYMKVRIKYQVHIYILFGDGVMKIECENSEIIDHPQPWKYWVSLLTIA